MQIYPINPPYAKKRRIGRFRDSSGILRSCPLQCTPPVSTIPNIILVRRQTMYQCDSRLKVGFLSGDAPWASAPTCSRTLLSTGVVMRIMTRALRESAEVIPFQPPSRDQPGSREKALLSFLHSVDVLWCDARPGDTAVALELRHEHHLPCWAVLCARGTMPKGAEAMLFPWQQFIRPGDGLLFTSEADQAIWRRLASDSRLREWVIPLAVDEAFADGARRGDRERFCAELGVERSAPLILYVGRLNIQKNIHTLFQLFQQVRQAIPDAHLCLVGKTDDKLFTEFRVPNTGYGEYLRCLASLSGISEAVHFLGERFGENLVTAFHAADVVVNCSIHHRENFGIAQAEAQSCGKPVVCSDWGGFRDIVQSGRTGCLMDTVLTKNGIRVDWKTGSRHVIEILRKSELRSRLGVNASASAKERFSIDALSKRLKAILEELTEQSNISLHETSYRPTPYAHELEAHKRACGWYDGYIGNSEERQSSWRPAVYQGQHYALYETLLEPYVARLSRDLVIDDLDESWVPYVVSTLERDTVRRYIRNPDPIWPHHAYLDTLEWNVLDLIDGVRHIREIANLLPEESHATGRVPVKRALQRLYLEGFILFSQSEWISEL